MAIKSSAFGRVMLTDRDAEKFKAQITHGRPKAAAIDSVKRGVVMSRAFRSNGGTIRVPLSRVAKDIG